MDEGKMFGYLLLGIIFILGSSILYHRYKKAWPTECDPQLQAVHDYLNESITSLLLRMQSKIEDHFEDEYDDAYSLLRLEFTRQLDMAVDFNAFCVNVSRSAGWVRHVTKVEFSEIVGKDIWEITLSTSPTGKMTYHIPNRNIAHLIDELNVINTNNKMLIDMIKGTGQ